jgi:hypothetical protein
MENREYLLCTLLDCGYADLSMLDDVGYDIAEIVADAIDNYGKVTLNTLLATIFVNGSSDLDSAYKENKERIVEDINNEIKKLKAEYENDYPESTEEEWEESEEYQEVSDLQELLIDMSDFHPFSESDFFINYLDSHIYMPHLEFYRKYMGDEVAKVEDDMGISFTEIA